ncbi:MAG TPA: DUF1587 domain-containing protein, partial [Pirellulales bacterium]|nr:DUF1587 domain-containing protein [Pirellulales bacterium]
MFRNPLCAILSAAIIVLIGSKGHAADDPVEAAAVAEFRQQVEPLLAKYCQKCHAGSEPKGELALDGIAQRAAIETERQQWEKISEKLHALEMPPEDEPQPTAAERERIAAWIDAGLARHDCGRERDPGRVTIRRLNRNEYNNTIRDLVGIDFRPGDDFPSDDVGYGFDHIGDVLSMPPLLLEKYLTAAQQIVERALGSNQVNLVTGDVTGGQLVDHG